MAGQENKSQDLWTSVGNKCLLLAESLLDEKTVSAAATAETVRILVETAISIDKLNLLWELRSRYGERVFRDLL